MDYFHIGRWMPSLKVYQFPLDLLVHVFNVYSGQYYCSYPCPCNSQETIFSAVLFVLLDIFWCSCYIHILFVFWNSWRLRMFWYPYTCILHASWSQLFESISCIWIINNCSSPYSTLCQHYYTSDCFYTQNCCVSTES